MTARTPRLLVILYGERAGVIERRAGSLTFTYDDAYLAQAQATPLSLSMPPSTTAYTNRWVESYLRGLLPDNDDVRRRWASHFGLRDRDTFGLIAEIGSDAAGGALYLREETYRDQMEAGFTEPISEGEIAERLRRLTADATDWLGDDEHWSLAGAQSKFTLTRRPDGWGIAHGIEPSTHIVKPGITQIPGQALIEHVSMSAARSLGLEVATTTYATFEDQPAIVVERFDRTTRNGRLQRVHQEDFCQTFGLDPSRKYEADRGPGVRRIADRLRAVTTDDSVERFGKAVILNYLLGAPDAHAKNYSILLAGRGARLAPLYDVASGLTSVREGRLRYPKAAMSIGGERLFGEVRADHWDRFAGSVGLPPDQVRQWVSQYVEELPDALADALGSVDDDAIDARVVGPLLPRVRLLADMTRRGLADTGGGRRIGTAAAADLAAVSS